MAEVDEGLSGLRFDAAVNEFSGRAVDAQLSGEEHLVFDLDGLESENADWCGFESRL